MNREYFNTGENIQWLTVLGLASLTNIYGNHFLWILIFWSINILVFGNARRLFTENDSVGLMLLRRNLYILPLLLPLLIGVQIIFAGDNLLFWILVGIGCGVIPILYKYKEWQLSLSYDFIGMRMKMPKYHYFLMIYILIGAAFTEEFFFRAFIVQSTMESLGIFAILLSGAMFIVHHLGCKWADHSFSTFDYIVQGLLGLVSAILYYYSKSIIPSFALHLAYNFPHILVYLRGYKYVHTDFGRRYEESMM